ncbi:TPA: aldolase [Candidatus Falkowbacteria bacterium]|nr:MAG: Fructose-bisphosphate aldolase [Candidatus Falkowbacteria bacterium GW2011_GWF2_43_32]HBA36906.1 aldolase [Candidatus Falkowbacteria bacterium]
MTNFKIPASVPGSRRDEYRKNYFALTNRRGRLLLIAGDQKVEHLNDDFFGAGITPEDNNPEHLFKIAAHSSGGALAVHLGLAARYGRDYPRVPYVIKINGKTNLGAEDKNSSRLWWTVEDIVKFKKQSGLSIVGIGYTIYLGGRYEAEMLATAAKAVYDAHQAGLTAVLWIYPRGKNVKEEDVHTIAGAAGVAASLDADFVKLKYPYDSKNKNVAQQFQEVTAAAGRTKIICVGGSKKPIKTFLEELAKQIKISGTAGLAIGRNLHQRSLTEARQLSDALSAVIFHDQSAAEALKIYNHKKKPLRKSAGKFLGLF